MTEAVGPVFAAGFQDITKSGYKILYLPDLHNDELQAEGKAPVYWWLPNEVRLARKDGDAGDYKFNFIHFEGRRSAGTNVGVSETSEVTGGLLGFSTTSSPPGSILLESQNALIAKLSDPSLVRDKFWGRRTQVPPNFRPAPIVSNVTTVTNLSPNPDGSVPAAVPGGGGGAGGAAPAPAAGGGAAGSSGAAPPPGGRNVGPPIVRSILVPPPFKSPRSVKLRSAMRSSNLDQWYANIQGQGSGSVSPFAENAYSGLVGSLPAALIWSSFHGGTGGISVWQKLRMKVWSPVVHLHIHGDWDRIQDHMSAAANASGFFATIDVKAEFNNMVISGDIKVVVEIDTTLPNADKLQEAIEKRSDVVFQKFMDEAQKRIFDPAPADIKPAEASAGAFGFFGGGGYALKLRHDRTHLTLDYDERREIAYLQEYPISGQLEGLYDEIKKDPENEKKYFTTLFLDDWERKVSRVVKPVVNWPDSEQKWAGEPVSFLSAQIGYPNGEGALQWDGHIFQRTDPPDAYWDTAMSMKELNQVKNPPKGWTPDKTFVKRQIHFTEPPNENENPFVRISVEKNVVDLDPGDNGTPTSDMNLEVRVDNVGVLSVGPMFLGADLETPKQVVEVTFRATEKRADGTDRPPVKFGWKYDDQTEPRYWMIFTGEPGFIPKYQYQVRVIVKGSIFTKGMDWTGPWIDAAASGPLMVTVPTPDDPGVVKRDLVPTAKDKQAPPPSPARPSLPPPSALIVPPPSRGLNAEPSATSEMGWTGLVKATPAKSATKTKAVTPPPLTGKVKSNGGDDQPMFQGYSIDNG